MYLLLRLKLVLFLGDLFSFPLKLAPLRSIDARIMFFVFILRFDLFLLLLLFFSSSCFGFFLTFFVSMFLRLKSDFLGRGEDALEGVFLPTSAGGFWKLALISCRYKSETSAIWSFS